MHSTWIDKKTQSQLTNAVEALHIRMLQNVKQHTIGNTEKAKNWIVDNFSRFSHINFKNRTIRHAKVVNFLYIHKHRM